MIKRICLMSLIGLVTALLFFHHAIHTYLLNSAFQFYFRSEWGQTFHYNEVRREGCKLMFLHPTIDRGESQYSAEQLNLSYTLDLSKRTLNLLIEVEKPLLQLVSPHHEVDGALEQEQVRTSYFTHKPEFLNIFNWMQIRTSLIVKNGSLNLHAKEFPQMPVHIDFDIANNGEIAFDMAFAPHDQKKMDPLHIKSVLNIQWGQDQEYLIVKWTESLEKIAEFLPENLAKGLRAGFKNDRIEVVAKVMKQHEQVEIEGTAFIKHLLKESQEILFGGVLGHHQPSGWFYAKNLPLEKYLSPFLFRPDVLELSGIGECKGLFDSHRLLLKYNVEDIKLENAYLLIEAKELNSPIPNEFSAFHELDWNHLSHRGELPLTNVSYYEKHHGLLFEDISGKVDFHDQSLSVHDLETYCHDIYFAGSIALDYSDPAPGVFTLDVKSPTVTGKVSQIQKFLSFLNQPSLLSQFAFEGDLTGRNQGIELAFTFQPDGYHLKTDIQGAIHNGSLPFEMAYMSLKELSMDIDYHHDHPFLEFSDIQGILLIGKPRCAGEYIFTGNHFRFKDLKKQDIDFDLSVKDQDVELMRIVANTDLSASGLRQINLNRSLSHISHLYPESFVCQLNDADFETFKLESSFDLNLVLNDLKRFRKTGFLCLSHEMIENITSLDPFQGKMHLNIAYQPADVSLGYTLEGNDFHHFSLKGKKTDKKWIVDHLQWDKLNLFAELQQMEDKWKINSLGFNDGEYLLLGLQGDYIPDEGCLNAKINLCEINLKGLNHHKEGSLLSDFFPSEDILRTQGDMKLVFLPKSPWLNMQADMQAQAPQGTNMTDVRIKTSNELFQLSAHTQYRQCPFQIIINSQWPAFDHGDAIFVDPAFKISDSSIQPLKISWEKSRKNQLNLQSIHGQFLGLWCDLSANETLPAKPGFSALQGKVDIDFNSLCPLLTNSTAEKIRNLELGSFYTVDGIYWIHPSSEKNLMDTIFFQGNMTGVDTLIKGYRLSKVEGKVNYIPERLEMDQLMVSDPSGNLFCPHLLATFDRKTDDWLIDIPQIEIKKFRPTMLRKPRVHHSQSNRFKNLVVKKMELQNFNGKLSSPRTWKATGGLHFQNTTSKNLTQPLLAVPKEIIQHLEIDPALLNPVTGSIYYDLHNGQFFLTKMKDVFSEGRGSKFYLADSEPSWMDMEGNLSVRIRMKQHNLIFKIVEQFTLSIEGNIKKPLFSLQKQKK